MFFMPMDELIGDICYVCPTCRGISELKERDLTEVCQNCFGYLCLSSETEDLFEGQCDQSCGGRRLEIGGNYCLE